MSENNVVEVTDGSTIDVSQIKDAAILANRLGYKLAIDFNPKAKTADEDLGSWTVSMFNDDGPADELDGIVCESIDLETALDMFITEAEDEVNSDPSSFGENEDDEED